MKQHQMQSDIWAGLPAAVIAVIIGFLLSAVVPNSHAADRTWNGAEDGTTMSHGGNWVGNAAPAPTDNIIFSGTPSLPINNDITTSAGSAFAGITFDSTAGAFTFSGNAIYLGGGITNNSPNLQYFPAIVDLNAAARKFDAAVGPMQFDLVRNSTLIKDGTNTVTLSGTVDNANLQVVVTNGTLVLAKGGLPTSTRAIGGSSPVVVYTNGTLRIAPSTNTDQIYKNVALNIQGGTFQLQNSLEAVRSLIGYTNSVNSIVENGLANTTNLLRLGDGSNKRGIYDGAIRNGSAGVLNLEVFGNTMEQFDGSLTYSGTTTVNNVAAGTSRIIVNGTHIGGGDYNINGATATQMSALNGSGLISATAININTNASLAPGGALSFGDDSATFSDTVAILTISNALVNLTTNTGTLDLQLNGATAGSGYDQVAIAGSGTFSNNNANLKLTVGGGYNPAVGDKLTIVKVQGTSSANNIGVFSMLNGIPTDLSQGATFIEPGSGKYFQISYRAEGSTFDAGAGNGNDIMLQVMPSPSEFLTWRGNVNNAWDVGATANWRNTNGVACTFAATNNAIFDDTGSNNVPIDLTTALSPPNIIVNATNNYVFATSTAGKLTGSVVLTKTNTGTLSIVTDNDNTGTTIIVGGIVQVGTNFNTGTLSGAVNINPNGTLAYNHSDDKVIGATTFTAFSGAGKFVHNGSGQLTITADLSPNFTGNTTNTGGLLQFGDGSGAVGQIGGTVTVPPANTVRYYFYQDANIINALGGSGTVNVETYNGGTLTLATTAVSSNFNGTINLILGTRLHAQNGSSYAYGSGSTVNVPTYCQAWCDNASTPYNSIFNIAGTGYQWTGVNTPGGTGAISLFNATLNGAINLMDNARIGGTISGGSILCPISGNFRLEVWGNLGSYVLGMGPTNGVHSYASTLITSGTIRALNANAISTGPLTLDLAGDLQLNGNNLTVASLTSISSGMTNYITGTQTIQNNNTTNAATLTVGTDNSSSEYDGIFLDGGGAIACGLTKVGSGTLTLTGASTNTGAVTVSGGKIAMSGSGSFNKASKITAGSGAYYDVTSAGGTLTLNSGQTLSGSGTVNGNVTASAGSTINPGDTIGKLTIAGSLTLSGTLLMELNRTNSPATNDTIAATGALTPGGTLQVVNVGPPLHTNDTFHLFPSGITNFTVKLPLTDAHSMIYTWETNITTDGSIRVKTAVQGVSGYLFRSAVNGNWSDVSTWQQSTNGVNWDAALGTPDYSSSNIVIQTGTTVTNTSDVIIDQTTVQAGGKLLVAGGSLIITNGVEADDILVAGTLELGAGAGILNITSSAGLTFTNGGVFNWNRAVLPSIPTATWRDGSTCRVSAMAGGTVLVTGISGQSFYDFIWDTTVAGQSTRGRLNITGTNTVIRHDFTVTIPDTSGASMTIYNETNGVLTVGRNVALNGGTSASGIKILLANAGGSTNNLFKVGGNFTATGYIDGFGTCSTLFDFNGTGSQSLTLPSSTFLLTPAAMNWQVEAGSSVALASSVQAFNNFTNNGTLTFGANTMSGGTALVLNSGGTVSGNGTNMLVSGIGSIVNGGTLNLGSLPTFAGGESFTLFSASAHSGTFGTLLPATPDGTHTWVTTQLNTAGILAVSGGVNTNAPIVQWSIAGSTLSLAWPTNKGWTLLTNSVGLTAANQWFPYPNSANLTNVNITIDPTKTNVFFRMVYTNTP